MRFSSVKYSAVLLVLASTHVYGSSSELRGESGVTAPEPPVAFPVEANHLRAFKLSILREPKDGLKLENIRDFIAQYNQHIEDNTLLSVEDGYDMTLFGLLCEISANRIDHVEDNHCKKINPGSSEEKTASKEMKETLMEAHGYVDDSGVVPHSVRAHSVRGVGRVGQKDTDHGKVGDDNVGDQLSRIEEVDESDESEETDGSSHSSESENVAVVRFDGSPVSSFEDDDVSPPPAPQAGSGKESVVSEEEREALAELDLLKQRLIDGDDFENVLRESGSIVNVGRFERSQAAMGELERMVAVKAGILNGLVLQRSGDADLDANTIRGELIAQKQALYDFLEQQQRSMVPDADLSPIRRAVESVIIPDGEWYNDVRTFRNKILSDLSS